jgi:hypothetical protein
MKTFDLPIPDGCTEKELIESFEKIVMECGLTVASRGTLKTLPGSVHWHFKHQNDSGTLEATLQFNKGRFFLTYHDNRFADWIPDTVQQIFDQWKNLKCG